MEEIQFGFIKNGWCILITKDRDIKFDDCITTVLNPDFSEFVKILEAKDYNLRDGCFDIIRGFLNQVPENCGVFSVERTTFKFLIPSIYEEKLLPHIRESRLEDAFQQVLSSYDNLSDDELAKLVYKNICKLAKNISMELFDDGAPMDLYY